MQEPQMREQQDIVPDDEEKTDQRSGGGLRDQRTEGHEDLDPLLPREEAESLRQRWGQIQEGFVDEPRRSVEEADRVVTDVITRLASSFADERSRLERQWEGDDEVSTEDLRQALRHYRAFFERLLAA